MWAAAGAGAAGTGGLGLWAFSYNKENFQNDQGQRFGRFMAARGFANAQVGQYRQDVEGLTELTHAKMDTWTTVSTLMLCVCAALSCAGRIGMHGAAPPGYMCALFSGNIFAAGMYVSLAMWLGMHGSLRAQCAAVSMLTRKVRLPIPSMKMIDDARNFGSAYERQEWRDIFRIPYCRHVEHAPNLEPAAAGDSDEDEEPLMGKAKKDVEPKKKKPKKRIDHDPRIEFGSSTRTSVPSWIRDEQVMNKGMFGSGAVHTPYETPDHFQMIQSAQEEWYMYDIYARICMLYGTCSFLFAVAYYTVGTVMCELRGFWIAWATPMLFICAQVCILRLDILQNSKQRWLPHCEWFGHVAPYMTVTALTIDLHLYFSPASITLTWVFVVGAFFCHFMMALRFLDLAWPEVSGETDMPDEPTKQWWPARWRVPHAFSKALWFLAPPKKLEPGQHCLLHEMDDLVGSTGCLRRRKGFKGAAMPLNEGSKANLKKAGKLINMLQCDAIWNAAPPDAQQQIVNLRERYEEHATYGAEPVADAMPTAPLDVDALMLKIGELRTVMDTLDGASPSVGGKTAYTTGSTPFSDFQKKRAYDLPWQLARVCICTNILQWFFMMIVSGLECHLGPVSLLKPPGEPPWIRDIKMRSWTPYEAAEGLPIHFSSEAEEGVPEGYRLFNPPPARPQIIPGKVGGPSAFDTAHHRRLLETPSEKKNSSKWAPSDASEAMKDLLKVLPYMGQLTEALDIGQAAHAEVDVPHSLPHEQPKPMMQKWQGVAPNFMMTKLKPQDIAWPAFFEPRHLLCGPAPSAATGDAHVVALTRRGFGALAMVGGAQQAEAKPFALDGVGEFGPLAGASWSKQGLELVTQAGTLLHCPGHTPTEHGVWPCKTASAPALPMPSGASLLAAAVGDHADSVNGMGRRLAMVHEESPEIVSIFAEDGVGKSWSPVGEVHVPRAAIAGQGERISLAFAGHELLITQGDGVVHRRHTVYGTQAVHQAPMAEGRREFHAACASPKEGLLRLALRPAGAGNGAAWVPELLKGM
jgi:hypothetical protein